MYRQGFKEAYHSLFASNILCKISCQIGRTRPWPWTWTIGGLHQSRCVVPAFYCTDTVRAWQLAIGPSQNCIFPPSTWGFLFFKPKGKAKKMLGANEGPTISPHNPLRCPLAIDQILSTSNSSMQAKEQTSWIISCARLSVRDGVIKEANSSKGEPFGLSPPLLLQTTIMGGQSCPCPDQW